MSSVAILTDRFDRALLYATHVHGGQMRKSTSIPYVAHLLAVAATVLEYGGSEDMAIAGLLHDAVEDQGGEGRLADICNRFGDRVGAIVKSCSDSLGGPVEKKPPWRERKQQYIEGLSRKDQDTFSSLCLTRSTMPARFCGTCGGRRSAMRSGAGSTSRESSRFGIIANWLRSSAAACRGNSPRSCARSSRPSARAMGTIDR